MSRRILTQEQVAIISKNKNVRRCSSKSIRYRKEFIAKSLDLYNKEGMAATEIFQLAGFDLEVIGKRVPNKLMHHWNKSLRSHVKIQRPKLKLSEEAKQENNIRRLKARVAYLEAENDFLAKLRARKRR